MKTRLRLLFCRFGRHGSSKYAARWHDANLWHDECALRYCPRCGTGWLDWYFDPPDLGAPERRSTKFSGRVLLDVVIPDLLADGVVVSRRAREDIHRLVVRRVSARTP